MVEEKRINKVIAEKKSNRTTIVAKESDPINDAVAKVRAKRASLRRTSGSRNVLAYPSRPGFKRRVVNDAPGRIKQFQDNGWEIVHGDETGGELTAKDSKKPGAAVTKVVGARDDGPITGVLMEIPEEIFNEDKQVKQDEIKRTEEIMEYKLKKDSVQWKGHSVESDFG